MWVIFLLMVIAAGVIALGRAFSRVNPHLKGMARTLEQLDHRQRREQLSPEYAGKVLEAIARKHAEQGMSPKGSLLLIGGDDPLRNLLHRYLDLQGFSVICIAQFSDYLFSNKPTEFQTVIFEGEPEHGQIEVIRLHSDVPILVLGSRTQHDVTQRIYRLGKPFEPKALLESIEALSRVSQSPDTKNT